MSLLKTLQDLTRKNVGAAPSASAVPGISAEELIAWGVKDVAYIRPEKEKGEHVYVIHAAEGTRLAVADTHVKAQALILRNDMKPCVLH